jgi:ribosomal protein L1
MNNDDITDRNVEQLDFVGKVLGGKGLLPRTQPGSRSDGGMQSDPIAATQEMMQKVVETELKLRKEVVHLQNQLGSERDAREHLEKIIRAVADLIVNGHKDSNT